jgi:hypothetical protein
MDRTNIFAAVAAITATSVVIFEYLRYSERRSKVQNVPDAADADQRQAAETGTDQLVQGNGGSDLDLSAYRQALVSRSQDDQLRLRTKLVMKHYELHCSCDEHAQNIYFNWPYSCSVQHKEDDIVHESLRAAVLP